MTCPRCKCPECAKVELNAVLGKIVSRETISPEQHNAAVLSNIEERSAWRDTFPDHTADLANAVAGLADELQRGRG